MLKGGGQGKCRTELANVSEKRRNRLLKPLNEIKEESKLRGNDYHGSTNRKGQVSEES